MKRRLLNRQGSYLRNFNDMDPRVERVMTAAQYIAAKLDGKTPYAGIVLGSGLGKLADKIEKPFKLLFRPFQVFRGERV